MHDIFSVGFEIKAVVIICSCNNIYFYHAK